MNENLSINTNRYLDVYHEILSNMIKGMEAGFESAKLVITYLHILSKL